MNLSQLIKQVNRDVDDSFNTADITDWFNRCLDDLTSLVKKEAKTTYTIDSTNNYVLPTDMYEIYDIQVVTTDSNTGKNDYEPLEIVSQRDYQSKGYKIWSGALNLQNCPDTGSIDFYYYRKVARLVNPADIPEIEESYHDLLILYAIAMSQYMDDMPDRQADAYNRYAARKAEYEAYKNRAGYNVYEINEVV